MRGEDSSCNFFELDPEGWRTPLAASNYSSKLNYPIPKFPPGTPISDLQEDAGHLFEGGA